jgi:hypothetical protein
MSGSFVTNFLAFKAKPTKTKLEYSTGGETVSLRQSQPKHPLIYFQTFSRV